ncbi:histidine kinase [Tissierella praeacuta]|uniref:histidine kinase n=1 Tax=Tissierella praeacuta TaxID=43131 RepID=UPI001C116197|nr:histidine kinase [Tissierella praeacuta]MBU5255909.1 histidine kinase [Tissierella praeacuta]
MGHIQYFDWGSIEWIYEPDTKNSTNIMHIGISTILPGRRQREHIHYGDEQLLYVLSGQGEQLIGKELSIKKPGSLFHIDAGSVHEAINTGEEPIKELLISVPVYYNQRNPLNDILNREQIYIGSFKDTIILNDRIKHLYYEAIDILAVPLSIFNKENEPIIVSDNYPEFCMKKCNVHKDIRNCYLYNIYDEYMPPHYKDPSAFVCQYGLRVFVMPIIINHSLVGTIKGGHIRIYDENHVGLKDETDSDYELYGKMQIVHQGRIMAILQHIKTLSKNISYYYLLENTEIELNKKEEIIKDIAKNELLLEESLRSTKEQVLSIQINNHFLFNTLNAIASLAIREGSIKTYESIISLSKIFRYSLKSSNTIVTLNDEILFIMDYLELQKLRYGERLNVNINICEEVKLARIPFNFIQPIIENSFIHGFRNKVDNLNVEISCTKNKDKVVIHVQDNGAGLEEDDITKLNHKIKGQSEDFIISGLMMIYRKLELLHHNNFEFNISSKKNVGTQVTIIIPAFKEEI